jgi:hypothetical protein
MPSFLRVMNKSVRHMRLVGWVFLVIALLSKVAKQVCIWSQIYTVQSAEIFFNFKIFDKLYLYLGILGALILLGTKVTLYFSGKSKL